jgi:hypothetical protein
VKQIACLDLTVLALLTDGRLLDVVANTFYVGLFESISASSSFVGAIDTESNAGYFQTGHFDKFHNLAKNAAAIGCTDSVIFVSTRDGKLWAFEDPTSLEVAADEPIVTIQCSDTEVLFLANSGNLYRFELGALLQIYGLPTIVSIATGPQHYCAISPEGKLFTWGFNPSGQLGIGNDRPTIHPSFVLDHVVMAACGTHHTICIRSAEALPLVPRDFDKAKLNRHAGGIYGPTTTRVTRAELIF